MPKAPTKRKPYGEAIEGSEPVKEAAADEEATKETEPVKEPPALEEDEEVVKESTP